MTDASPFSCVLDIRASLGECPLWSTTEQVLYWVDINAPSLNRFDPASGHNFTMPMPESIGSYALRERGGFVVALRSGIWLCNDVGRLERQVVAAPYDATHYRFNDGRCDAQGRFVVGSMNSPRVITSTIKSPNCALPLGRKIERATPCEPTASFAGEATVARENDGPVAPTAPSAMMS